MQKSQQLLLELGVWLGNTLSRLNDGPFVSLPLFNPSWWYQLKWTKRHREACCLTYIKKSTKRIILWCAECLRTWPKIVYTLKTKFPPVYTSCLLHENFRSSPHDTSKSLSSTQSSIFLTNSHCRERPPQLATASVSCLEKGSMGCTVTPCIPEEMNSIVGVGDQSLFQPDCVTRTLDPKPNKVLWYCQLCPDQDTEPAGVNSDAVKARYLYK